MVQNHNIVSVFERALSQYPDKEAYGDGNHSFTYKETATYAGRIATVIAKQLNRTRGPIAVFMEKSIEEVVAFWGILFSGNFYCPIDIEMPESRAKTILQTLQPAAIITDLAHCKLAEQTAGSLPVLLWETCVQTEADAPLLETIRCKITENDPLYALFTSGSTGVPKGVLVSQRVMLNYLSWLDESFSYSEQDVFGNQAPLYFDVSVHDIFGAAYFGAKMEIIPEHYFGFPVQLIRYMNEKKISTFLWVPSAMGIVAKLKAFHVERPQYLKHAMFAGEVLPRKQLDYWVQNLPETVYANLYGPTETFVCTAYTFQGDETEGQPLPIGKAISNCEAILLDESGRPVPEGEAGELCLRGSCLALGYYNNPERTAAAFVQNPLNNAYPERLYKTGDLARLDENGNLIYVSRKDYQIKHMGYRIELGEIESAVSRIEGIGDCACIYDQAKKRILLFYDGKEWEQKDLLALISKSVPSYMIPGRIYYMQQLPHNQNGKIDRKQLAEGIGK